MGKVNQRDFLNRGRPCTGPGPIPTNVHYYLLGSGTRRYELVRPLKINLRFTFQNITDSLSISLHVLNPTTA